MGIGSDRFVGFSVLVITVVLFTYYTFWTLITPFIDKGHFIHSYFPNREYAIIGPLTLLIVGVTTVFTFLSLVMIKSGK